MKEIEIPSAVYVIGEDAQYSYTDDVVAIQTHTLVKRAKQRFAEDYEYDYKDLQGKCLKRIPAYGMCVHVCYKPSLRNKLRNR